ncbi:hypothetical protein ACTXT7_003760 [Hymenolepis weldensis]
MQSKGFIGSSQECSSCGYINGEAVSSVDLASKHSEKRNQLCKTIMAATFPEMTRTVSFGPMSDNTSRPQSQRSHSVVSIALYNENGEDDIVEIDEADDVFQDPVNSRLSSCEFISFAASSENDMRFRRQSIADRVNRRRNTEFAFEFTRVEAAGRAKEFLRLLEEHSRLVHSVQFWSTAAAMQDNAKQFAVKLQLDSQNTAQTETQSRGVINYSNSSNRLPDKLCHFEAFLENDSSFYSDEENPELVIGKFNKW